MGLKDRELLFGPKTPRRQVQILVLVVVLLWSAVQLSWCCPVLTVGSVSGLSSVRAHRGMWSLENERTQFPHCAPRICLI